MFNQHKDTYGLWKGCDVTVQKTACGANTGKQLAAVMCSKRQKRES